MPGATTDIKVFRYGVEIQPTAFGVGANQQLYEGCVALVSGSGSTTTGYLKSAVTPLELDLVAGLVGEPAGGTQVETEPGILGGTTDGAVWVNVLTGTFMIQSGTGADALTAANNGKNVYYGGENAQGPIACTLQSNGGGTRPVLGIQLPQDPGFANNYIPGSNYWPIKLNVIGGPGGV